jgi:hypothetical protein
MQTQRDKHSTPNKAAPPKTPTSLVIYIKSAYSRCIYYVISYKLNSNLSRSRRICPTGFGWLLAHGLVGVDDLGGFFGVAF